MKWHWPFRPKPARLPAISEGTVREAAEVKRKAQQKLAATQANTPQIEALSTRLQDQLHNKNHIGRMFDEAFKGSG